MRRSDEELYRLMKLGDSEAFAELYERREPALYRYALHASGSPTVAEEVAAEVFVQLMSAGSRYDERRGTLESYLYGVARNLVRAAKRQGPVEEAVETAFDHDILGGLIDSEMITALYRALESMPERYRDVVIFCDLEERSYEDVARLIGRPIGTVRSRLHRGRALLAGIMKRINNSVASIAGLN